VEFVHRGAAGGLMVAVHVLGDDHQIAQLLQISQGLVGGVGARFRDETPPPVVPAPDQFGIGHEGLQGGQFLGPVLAPQAVFTAAEGGDAAGGRDAGAGQDADLGLGGDGAAQFFQLPGDIFG
jgi:hypothetical protein